jgi:amidohydrolase
MTSAIPNDTGTAIRQIIEQIEPQLIEIRRDIHAHPELAFEEVRTSGVIAAELERLGIPFQRGIGKTGVVGLIEGGRPGPVLAIRADMDALPMQEKTGLPFASQVDGRMHACGHDIHSTTLLGVAAALKQIAPSLAGTVKLLFQPAEETIGGMAAMIADGIMDNPRIDMALGFHNHPDMPAGQFMFVRGPTLAAADRFDIVIKGRSGHAAYPHNAVDPLAAAAWLVTQLQSIVTREVHPMQPAVLSVTSIQGGTAYNIIPDSCAIKGTVRTLHAQARDTVQAAMERMCAGMRATMRVECECHYDRGVPALVNDDRVLLPSVAAIRSHFGDDAVTEGTSNMGAEDFALLAERVPAFQLRVGSSQPGRKDHLHNSDYQPDERCIGLGAQAVARAAMALLS